MDNETKSRIENDTIESAKNLLHSMEDILIWSKNQMENFVPKFENVLVLKIFNDTRNHFYSEKDVLIVFENPENIEIHTDENYLKTIIRNLTSNAIKAVSLDTARDDKKAVIIWKAWQEQNIVYLSISDNGKGAENEQFQALYDDSAVIGVESGLGLHLIRDLANAIECKISVDSKIGIGTQFVLKFEVNM